jgi:diguanylate cyclase (GGDEF)-like protein
VQPSLLIHVPTLVITTVVTASLLGGLLVMTWLQTRECRALLWWAACFFLAAVCTVLLAARGIVPNFWSIEIANAMSILAAGCAWAGARDFEGRTVKIGWLLYPPLAWIALCQVPIVAESIAIRVVIMSIILPAFIWLGAYEFWRGRQEYLVSRWPSILTMGVYGLALASRIPALYLQPLPSSEILFQGHWFASIQFCSLIYITLISFLNLALYKERIEIGYRRAARTDSLTQLLTRGAFFDESERVLKHLNRRKASAVIIAVDLDSFKQINDRFGHLVGDTVLKRFADVARSELRANDVVGRIGGEEFAILLPMQSPPEAMMVAERLRRSFEDAARTVDETEVRGTLSAGVAVATGAKLIALLAEADRALYAAKRAGRNCTHLAAAAGETQLPALADAKQRAA